MAMAKAAGSEESSTASPSSRNDGSICVEDRSSRRRSPSSSSRRLLRRTSTEYFGDVSRALLPGPPRLVTQWMKQATQAKTVEQTVHATRTSTSTQGRQEGRFTSQHHDGGYVWPIHDVVANEILMWLLPTHMLTHLIKFTVVLLGLLFTLLFSLWYEKRTEYQHHRTDDGLADFEVTTMVLVASWCQKYWPNLVAGVCFLCIPTWIYYMYQTTLYAFGKPWMDPRLPSSENRLEMHVPLRFYTSARAARQGACHMELVSRDTLVQDPTPSDGLDDETSSRQSLAPNVMNLDGPDWKFQLLPTVEQAMHVVYQDELSNNVDNDNNLHNNTTSNHRSDWSDMNVPSNWMFRNGKVPFDKPIYTNQKYPFPCTPPIVPRENPTGVYRKVISFPEEWMISTTLQDDDSHDDDGATCTYTILLHGIESACFVYWNFELIGFCKDSRLPSEFAIPQRHFSEGDDDSFVNPTRGLDDASLRYVGTGAENKPREHVLHLVIARWSDGSYVEDQDHWWMAGVHRSVELIRRPPKADIMDFKVVQANHHGKLHVQVVTRGEQERVPNLRNRTRYVKLSLFHDAQHVVSTGAKTIQEATSVGSCSTNDDIQCCWGPSESQIWSETQTILSEINPNGETFDAEQSPLSPPIPTDDETTLNFLTVVDNPHLWTAETPNLYTLIVEQYEEDTGGDGDESEQVRRTTTTQVESCRIGFRSVEVTQRGILNVNGRPITICGINRHEHDPDHGKVVSLERMKQDIIVLKKSNFNSIRLSHYPNHISFYRLCDYYGMYVCDEANIETHGMKPMGRLAQDWGWENTFVSRVRRMVQRDINHPCIIFWSLGNEAGRGRNLSLARQLILDLDDTRPVVYESGGSWAEGVGRTELTDIICPMYPNVSRTIHMAQREDEDRPVILCEYSHSMNNSNGNLHLYWEAFWNPDIPRLQGGFIWDMLDQGLRKISENGVSYFGYGGDFGDTINDAQFCINGMFTPDRKPHPAVHEIKFLQQPIDIYVAKTKEHQVVLLDVYEDSIETLELRLQNRYAFRDLSHIHWRWSLMCDRSTDSLVEGTAPSHEELLHLDFGSGLNNIREMDKLKNSKFECLYYLNIEGCLAESQTWAEAGHVVVSKQFSVRFNFINRQDIGETPSFVGEDSGPLRMKEDGETIVILRGGDTPLITVSKATGSITSINWDEGRNALCGGSGIVPNFTRAATDNDRGGIELVLDHMCLKWATPLYKLVAGFREFSHEHVWDSMGLSQNAPPKVVCGDIKSEGSGDRITISVNCSIVSHLKRTLFTQLMIYDVHRNGSIRISCRITPHGSIRTMPSLARVGLSFVLDPVLSHIQYFGRGPNENYSDRKLGSWMGIWDARPSEMGFDYIVPQENGNRSDCEWVAFRSCCENDDVNGTGMLVVAEPGSNFSFSALLHSQEELHHATHSCDLDAREDGSHPLYVTIDHKLMGLGGDVSWFPRVYPQFLVKPKEYNFSLWLLPLSKGKSAPVESRRIG